MKLLFTKEENGDIKAQIQQGTIAIDFSYTEMVKQLLDNNEIDDVDFVDLDEDEKGKINEMLEKIRQVFIEEENSDEDLLEDLL